jgi:nucleoid DNA-binding protein
MGIKSMVTKADLVSLIVERTGVSKAAAGRLVNELLGLFTDELLSGGSVFLSGFGKFKVINKAPRRGVNPSNGEMIMHPARRAVVFRSSSKLKELVNLESPAAGCLVELLDKDKVLEDTSVGIEEAAMALNAAG